MHIRSSFTQSDDEKWKRWVRGAWNRRKIEERESERKWTHRRNEFEDVITHLTVNFLTLVCNIY